MDCKLQMCSKRYQKWRFDVNDGEVFKVLKKIGETGRAFRIANEHGQLGHLQRVPFCSLKCRGQFINGVSVIRINFKKPQEKPLLMGLLCIGLPEPIEHNPFNCVRLTKYSVAS